jgi:glyoxylase-like metal-dependent hydrolase (beta-lactamase superfamily II)
MRLGDIELVPLLDAKGVFGPLADLWPEVSSAEWEPYRPLYPELFDGDRWRPSLTCYLIRVAGTTLLVDTGVADFEWLGEPELVGGLLPALAEHAVTPPEVDVVFLTHLHLDHFAANGAFDHARFVMHGDAIAAARERADRPHIAQCVLPLLDAGRVDEITDGAEVAPGVDATVLAGHDAGHTGLRIGSEAVLIADAAGHPAMLDEPEWLFLGDQNPSLAAVTREALVGELVDTETLVVCGHFPGTGIGKLERAEDGRVVWREARSG